MVFHLLRENCLKPSPKGINAIIINFKAIGHMFNAILGGELFIGTLWLPVRILPLAIFIATPARHYGTPPSCSPLPRLSMDTKYASSKFVCITPTLIGDYNHSSMLLVFASSSGLHNISTLIRDTMGSNGPPVHAPPTILAPKI